MSIKPVTRYYVVCDKCGDQGDSFPTREEADDHGWPWETSEHGKHLCEVCDESYNPDGSCQHGRGGVCL